MPLLIQIALVEHFALSLAVDELNTGKCDVAIVGGVSVQPYQYMLYYLNLNPCSNANSSSVAAMRHSMAKSSPQLAIVAHSITVQMEWSLRMQPL